MAAEKVYVPNVYVPFLAPIHGEDALNSEERDLCEPALSELLWPKVLLGRPGPER